MVAVTVAVACAPLAAVFAIVAVVSAVVAAACAVVPVTSCVTALQVSFRRSIRPWAFFVTQIVAIAAPAAPATGTMMSRLSAITFRPFWATGRSFWAIGWMICVCMVRPRDLY